jgi:hypothetical protein
MIGGFVIYTFGVPYMELNIIWQPWDSSGLEQLHLSQNQDGIAAYSIIIGAQDNIPFSLQYTLHCTPQWHVHEANLRVESASNHHQLTLQSDTQGHWFTSSGEPLPSLNDCLDIDISATPFTNTLPIRRLELQPEESAEILVVYISLPDLQFQAALQRYTCLENRPNGSLYRYESLDSGYTNEIEVDRDGIVIDYPDLFRRVRPEEGK